ncbi:MAG: hypothetical protein ABGZ31_03245, partial [Roseibacillus sp.]
MKRASQIFLSILVFGHGANGVVAQADTWGKITTKAAEFYAASDVPASQVELTKQWHQVASKAWGNFGPLEFW